MVDFWVKIEFYELDFVIYQYLRWERYKEKRVHWTRLPYMENEFVELVFLVYFFFTANTTNTIWSSAPSLTRFDQVQTQPDLIKQPAKHDLIRKRVQWTRFPCMEDEFVELVFHLWKTSLMNSFFLVYFFNTDTGKITKSSSSNSILTQKSAILDSNC